MTKSVAWGGKEMRPWEETDSLEGFMRRQERLIKQNELYKRLIIIPVVAIVVSISVLSYNFTVGKEINYPNVQSVDSAETVKDDAAAATTAEKINLNTATAKMLDGLPGIGAKKAEAIVELRSRMEGFRSVEDILNVDGIGEKILSEIQHMLYVEVE